VAEVFLRGFCWQSEKGYPTHPLMMLVVSRTSIPSSRLFKTAAKETLQKRLQRWPSTSIKKKIILTFNGEP
jgi:hypothetical protein